MTRAGFGGDAQGVPCKPPRPTWYPLLSPPGAPRMGDPAARPKPAISRAEWGLLLLLAAVQFTNILDFVIIMPLAPMAKRDFGINSTQFGNVVAAYGFASFVGSILAAKFLDRFG